jgi:hypothetical protein
MERRFDSPWRATAIGVVALALLAFALFMLLDGNGSEPGRELERSAIQIDTEEPGGSSKLAPPEAGSGNTSKVPAKTEDSGSGEGRSQQAPSQGSDRREEPSTPPASDVVCPAEISREECELLAATAEGGDSSVAIRKPSDCLKIMSRAECIELLREQKAAAAQSESSFSVQECLDGEAPREPCRQAFEQMREASQ